MPVIRIDNEHMREESLRTLYERQKDMYLREGVPFMSYLHERGWLFLRLDEVEALGREQSGDKINRAYRTRYDTLRVTRKGQKDFDRIVAKLQRKGTLIDATYHLARS